jgi:hypothetical protein
VPTALGLPATGELSPLALASGAAAAAQEPPASLDTAGGSAQRLPNRFLVHHIWKCGGTHLCDVARGSGFAVPKNNGCHRFKNDSRPVDFDGYTDPTTWNPCVTGGGLAKLPFSVIGHECFVDAKTLDYGEQEGFTWVGALRDPVEQALSWLAHTKYGWPELRNLNNLEEWVKVCNEAHNCGWYTFIPNLQTRWLAGGECLKDPEKEDCLQLALASLRRMAVVLEQSRSILLGQDRLVKLGWKPEKPENVNNGARSELAEMASQERAFVENVQQADIKLIGAARAEGLI